MLDGQTADTDKPFKVDGYELMYPGDRSAPGYLVYNCRCTTIAVLPDVDTSDALRRDENGLLPDMTFAQWEASKRGYGVDPISKYNIQKKTVANSAQSGKIKEERLPNIGLQFFANSGISKWKTSGIEKAISKWQDRILEHEDKIQNPEKYDTEWDSKLQIARDGEIYHWQKEIRNFNNLIKEAQEELERRKNNG